MTYIMSEYYNHLAVANDMRKIILNIQSSFRAKHLVVCRRMIWQFFKKHSDYALVGERAAELHKALENRKEMVRLMFHINHAWPYENKKAS